MADSLSSVGTALRVPYSYGRKEGAGPSKQPVSPEAASPDFSRVVEDLNTVARKMAQELRVELDLGAGKLGARVIGNAGLAHPIPLKYVAQTAAILRYSGDEAPAAGGLVDEKA